MITPDKPGPWNLLGQAVLDNLLRGAIIMWVTPHVADEFGLDLHPGLWACMLLAFLCDQLFHDRTSAQPVRIRERP